MFGLAKASEASKQQIALAYNSNDVRNTKAMAVLARPMVVITDKTIVYVNEPLECAMVKTAKCFIQEGVYKDYTKIPKYSYQGTYYFVEGSVQIGTNTVIGQNVFLGVDVSVGNGCLIEPNVQIKDGTIIGDDVHISSGSIIGADAFYQYYDSNLKTFCGIGKVVIQDGVSIGANTVIQRGVIQDTCIGEYSQIGDLVNIGHDVQIGKACKIVSQTGIAGNVLVGSHVLIYGQSGIANDVCIGDGATIMGKSSVTKDISAGQVVSGMYARQHWDELRLQAKMRKLQEV